MPDEVIVLVLDPEDAALTAAILYLFYEAEVPGMVRDQAVALRMVHKINDALKQLDGDDDATVN